MSRILRILDENIRVLPVLIIAAAALVSFKSADLWQNVQSELLGVTPALAAGSSGPSNAPSTDSEDHYAPQAEDEGAAAPSRRTLASANDYYDDEDVGLSRAEVQVLESLANRREQLTVRENELATRERLIEAAERRVEERISELRSLETHIEELLLLRDEEEEAQLASLVTVYENMRAKDAATIFERLDEDILVDVASRMREQRIALILAEMAPDQAQELTVRLATRLNFSDTDGFEGAE